MDLPGVDDLYGVRLEEFIPSRKALAVRLRGEGRRDEATAVSRLAKPTLTAWAINVAVRRRPDLRDTLVDAGRALRAAQERALSGDGPDVVRAAAGAQRSAIGAVLEVVAQVLDEEERGGGPTQQRARETLHAAALDPDVEAELVEGRLTREHVPIALGNLDLGAPSPPRTAAPPPPQPVSAPEPAPARVEDTALRAALIEGRLPSTWRRRAAC